MKTSELLQKETKGTKSPFVRRHLPLNAGIPLAEDRFRPSFLLVPFVSFCENRSGGSL